MATDKCKHEWDLIEEEPGAFRLSVCLHCGAQESRDLVSGQISISEELEDGQIERDGCLYCGACGMLAQGGDEEYDWCDHHTGDNCAYMPEESDDDDFDPDDMEESDYEGRVGSHVDDY